MSDSDDQMEVDATIPLSFKGKGKAVENNLPYQDDSLPWQVAIQHRSFAPIMIVLGLKNIAQ